MTRISSSGTSTPANFIPYEIRLGASRTLLTQTNRRSELMYYEKRTGGTTRKTKRKPLPILAAVHRIPGQQQDGDSQHREAEQHIALHYTASQHPHPS